MYSTEKKIHTYNIKQMINIYIYIMPRMINIGTYHLMIKFPTEYRVEEIRGDQMVACEYYIAMLEMDDHLQTMNIEEQLVEPVERLEEILLDNSKPDRTTRIGTLANSIVC